MKALYIYIQLYTRIIMKLHVVKENIDFLCRPYGVLSDSYENDCLFGST